MGQHFTLGAGPAQIMGQHVLPGCTAVAAYKYKTAPRNFPQPRNTTLLHESYLTTTQILQRTPYKAYMQTRKVTMERGFSLYFGSTSLAASTFTCEDLVPRK